MSIPCYADDARALNGLIDEELASFGLKISPDARALLADSLGGDRLASRGKFASLLSMPWAGKASRPRMSRGHRRRERDFDR